MDNLSWTGTSGLTLHAQCWSANHPPKAVIALVHGAGEHIGRYAHVAHFFNERNIALMGYDQQGHGQSGGRRGHIVSADSLLNDAGLLLDAVHQRFPGVPVFLWGHSMGGNVALNYLLRKKTTLAGAVISSPWIQLAFRPPAVKVWAGKLVSRLAPALSLANGLDTGFLSRDPEVVKAYEADPLVHDKVTAGGGTLLMHLAEYLDTAVADLPLPLLLVHGSADKITSAEATRAFALRAKGDVTFREWPGLYHELHNEPEKETYLRFVFEWMAEKGKW
jgi:alpha-beta hydrolase superfamily lysophospholipase